MSAAVVVHLATAVICYLGKCEPALIGKNTPVGEFPIVHMRTPDPGYGGDVLAFAQNKDTIFAIHRIWLLSPRQHRMERIGNGVVEDRQDVTGGCVNVLPKVYEELLDCCNRKTVLIEP